MLAGADLADGWPGFIDGAIESGLRAGALAARVSR
jgi:monoamine oxidase